MESTKSEVSQVPIIGTTSQIRDKCWKRTDFAPIFGANHKQRCHMSRLSGQRPEFGPNAENAPILLQFLKQITSY